MVYCIFGDTTANINLVCLKYTSVKMPKGHVLFLNKGRVT